MNYEQLGNFYIGKKYDIQSKSLDKKSLILYDSKDLLTHLVCLGMTGSGKTGLCTVILEEAIIDNIPIICIDLKGDISNLLLTFPELSKNDFINWINENEASKKGMSTEEYADLQSKLWKKGITEWDQNISRIKKLRQATEFQIYTPGSNAGIPISILNSFSIPPEKILEDKELLMEKISTTVTSLLDLLELNSDPLKSREHILLSKIIETSWKNNENLDLEKIIKYIQNPPIKKIGVLDLESFYSSEERFKFVMTINNLLASSSFSSWMEGRPLDIDSILYNDEGKPRVSIFSIAHLNENERMFFVTLFMNHIISWMRSQSGTTNLRAIFYIDEIFGYLPPVANPSSKKPLLTLLKQSRAFGLGIILATQNPVDLDYKALSNIGTWMIGRLQTERDKSRVLDGLEGISSEQSKIFDKKNIEKILSNLSKRTFLLKNVHENDQEIFQTRWALSYLRGPITKNQIKILMKPIKSKTFEKDSRDNKMTKGEKQISRSSKLKTNEKNKNSVFKKPTLPAWIEEYYLHIALKNKENEEKNQSTEFMEENKFIYRPMLLSSVTLNFTNSRFGLDITKEKKISYPVFR